MRKVCVVTSTRAEYGILSRLIDMLQADEDIELQLLVTGSHLSKKFGYTYKEIKNPITKKIDIKIDKEPYLSTALALEKFTKEFQKLKPDLILLLGDRYEIMGVAQAAMFNNLPIAHLYGGDTTEGAIDEAIRHSITKMSHLHFVSCEDSKKRVIQLGEDPKRVFNLGALSVENIKKMSLMTKDELETSMDFKFGNKNILVTFHPVTLEGDSEKQFSELLSALEELAKTNIIITCPNSDSGNDKIFELINKFEKTHKNVKSFKSLGFQRYLSCMQYVDAVVGNSSSGIYEAPSFNIPTVNIGNRQKGRMQAESIINCEPKKEDILKSIKEAFVKDCSYIVNPYEGENTASRMLEIIKSFDLNGIIKKEFYSIL